jgi:outer membrane protein TolC
MSSGLTSSLSDVGRTVEGLEGNLRGVSETLAHTMAGMETAHQRLETTLASSADRVASASDRFLAGVESQAATEQAMQRLSSSIAELGNRLNEFGEAQATLAPILNQLAGPLEIRLTPTALRVPGASTPTAPGSGASET